MMSPFSSRFDASNNSARRRRFVPLLPWSRALLRLAEQSQYATYSGHDTPSGYGFVSGCFAVDQPYSARRALPPPTSSVVPPTEVTNGLLGG